MDDDNEETPRFTEPQNHFESAPIIDSIYQNEDSVTSQMIGFQMTEFNAIVDNYVQEGGDQDNQNSKPNKEDELIDHD